MGYLALARRVLGMPSARLWQAHVPAVFASAGVALAVAATRWALTDHVRTLVVLGAEAGAGALALALCIRFCPLPAIRSELWMRLAAAGVLGEVGGRRWRLASLVLGRRTRRRCRWEDREHRAPARSGPLLVVGGRRVPSEEASGGIKHNPTPGAATEVVLSRCGAGKRGYSTGI